MADMITQWKTPPERAKVQDIAPPTAHLAPQAIAAVVTMATVELGRVCQVTVRPTVQQLAALCTTVESIVIAVQMVKLFTQNPREDLVLSNMTLRQSILRFFVFFFNYKYIIILLLLIRGLFVFVMQCQPP